MSLAAEFAEFLATDQVIQSVIGARIDLGRVQQGRQRPNCILNEVVTEPFHQLDGESGMSRTILQCDFWADGPDAVLLVKRAAYRVRARFAGGWVAPLITDGMHCNSVLVTRLDITGQRPQDGSDDYLYRASLDLEIIHEDSTADATSLLPNS